MTRKELQETGDHLVEEVKKKVVVAAAAVAGKEEIETGAVLSHAVTIETEEKFEKLERV